MKEIRAVICGCGRMGKIGTQYLVKKGVKIVGAIDANPALTGVDLGELSGIGALGIKISPDIDAVLEDAHADIAVCALFSLMSMNEPIFTKILTHGVNIITTCDEGHFSWNTAPEPTKRLDALAKEHGVTITGCGFQDIFWMNIAHTAAGGMVEITDLDGIAIWNTDDYGPALAEAYKVGYKLKDFEALAASAEGFGDGFLTRATNDAVCSRFGLTAVKHTCKLEPCIKDHDVYSKTLGRVIPAGDVVGTREIVITETAEGIPVKFVDECYVYDEGEYDRTIWHINGTPGVEVEMPRVQTHLLTMGTILNRIPDVINAAPGYVTNSEMDVASYHVTDLTLD